MTEIRSQETARSAVSVRLLPPCANTLMMRIKRRKELRHRDPQNTEHVRYGGADLLTWPNQLYMLANIWAKTEAQTVIKHQLKWELKHTEADVDIIFTVSWFSLILNYMYFFTWDVVSLHRATTYRTGPRDKLFIQLKRDPTLKPQTWSGVHRCVIVTSQVSTHR